MLYDDVSLNPNFVLEGASDALVLGSRGAGGKRRRTRRVRRGFTSVPMLPMTNADDVSANANFGLKEAELKSYFDSILLRDIVARYKLDSFRNLEKMAVLLLSSIANPMSVTKLSKTLGVSFDLANRYFEYLENTFLIHTLPLFDWSLKKQFTNPKKVYSIDTGLSKRVSFEVGKRKGDLLENIVYLELKRRFEELYYYKTKQGYGVDFVVKDREKITHLIQVSLSLENEKTKKRELRALVKAANELKYSDNMEANCNG